jgi:hemerythrin
MSLFVWKPEYSVGCAEIDQQHEKLFRIADELHRAILEQRSKEALAGLLKRLVDYTLYHFASEERLMQDYGYMKYLPHHVEHVRLTGRILEYLSVISKGDSAVTFDLLQFLSDWLQHHICGSDQKLGAHLRTCTGFSPAPAPSRRNLPQALGSL